jgi:hypothetical protein
MDFLCPRPECRGNKSLPKNREEWPKYVEKIKQLASEHPEDRKLQETMQDLESE